MRVRGDVPNACACAVGLRERDLVADAHAKRVSERIAHDDVSRQRALIAKAVQRPRARGGAKVAEQRFFGGPIGIGVEFPATLAAIILFARMSSGLTPRTWMPSMRPHAEARPVPSCRGSTVSTPGRMRELFHQRIDLRLRSAARVDEHVRLEADDLETSSSRKPFMIDMVRISAHTPSVMPITETIEMKARPPCSRLAPR